MSWDMLGYRTKQLSEAIRLRASIRLECLVDFVYLQICKYPLLLCSGICILKTGIHIRALPVYGMYQPDAIYMIKVNDVEYLITANEGDSKDYSGFPLNTEGFSEEIRAADADIAGNIMTLNTKCLSHLNAVCIPPKAINIEFFIQIESF